MIELNNLNLMNLISPQLFLSFAPTSVAVSDDAKAMTNRTGFMFVIDSDRGISFYAV